VSIALLWLRVGKKITFKKTKSLAKTKQTAWNSYESFPIIVLDKDHEGLKKKWKERVEKESNSFVLF
jgi:hypothetical protein